MSASFRTPSTPMANQQLLRRDSQAETESPNNQTPSRPTKQPKSILVKTENRMYGRKTNTGHIAGESEGGEDEEPSEESEETLTEHTAGATGSGDGNAQITSGRGNEGKEVTTGLCFEPGDPTRKRKASVIQEDFDVDSTAGRTPFPRKKVDRKMSNNGGKFQYAEVEAAALRSLAAEAKAVEDALASDSDDEVYKKLDEADYSDTDSLMQDPDEEAVLAESDDEAGTASEVQSQAADNEDDNDNPEDDDLWNAKLNGFFGPSGLFDDNDFEAHMFEHDFLEPPTPRRKSESSERRVRFQDEVLIPSSSSSSSSSDFDVDTFPDLLDSMQQEPIVPQESLDHLLLHQIEGQDDDLDLYGGFESDAGSSEYDFGENEAVKHVFRRMSKAKDQEDEESSGSESGSLSGYDSDGDTTDDEMPVPQSISRPKTVLHSPPNSVRAKPTPKPFPRTGRPVKRRGPVMGSFQTSEDKPYAYYDATARRLRIVNTPKKKNLLNSVNSSASNSPHVSFNNVEYPSDNDFSQMSSLFPSGSVDIMMSGLFGGPPGQRYQNGRFVSNPNDLYGGNFGAPEAFFAQKLDSVSEEGSDFTTEDENSSAGEVDMFSDFLHMEKVDLGIDFDEDDDDDTQKPASSPDKPAHLDDDPEESSSPEDNDIDTENQETSAAEGQTPVTSSAKRAGITNGTSMNNAASRRARNLSNSMLAHFDRASVTAFRNNQDRYRHLQRLPSDPMSKPLKAGKTASDVMTPPRRRKAIRKGMGMGVVGRRGGN